MTTNYDLFSKQMQVAIHNATQTEIIIQNTEWYKGEISYNCLVPQKDDKGKYSLCNATYCENEITLKD